MSKNKKAEGIVYSTNPDFEYSSFEEKEPQTLPPFKQKIKVLIDSKSRGKVVTVITGFVGTSADMDELCKKLKTKLGTGGTVKARDIIIQGNFKEKVSAFFKDLGYGIK